MPAGNCAVRIPPNLRVVMSVQIDETRSYDQAVPVDGFFGEAVRAAADLSNFAVLDPYIGAIPWHAGAVDDRTAFNQDIHVRHFVTSIGVGAGQTVFTRAED